MLNVKNAKSMQEGGGGAVGVDRDVYSFKFLMEVQYNNELNFKIRRLLIVMILHLLNMANVEIYIIIKLK